MLSFPDFNCSPCFEVVTWTFGSLGDKCFLVLVWNLKKKNQPKVGFLFGRTEGEAIKNSLETLKNWEFCSPALFFNLLLKYFRKWLKRNLPAPSGRAANTTLGGGPYFFSGHTHIAPPGGVALAMLFEGDHLQTFTSFVFLLFVGYEHRLHLLLLQ